MVRTILREKKNQAGWKPLDAYYFDTKEDFEIYSRETMIKLYDDEQKRAARNGTVFSLLIFSFDNSHAKIQHIETMITLIKQKIRIIDHLGWCCADKLAILLPGTGYTGADLLRNKIVTDQTYDSVSCEVSIETSDNEGMEQFEY